MTKKGNQYNSGANKNQGKQKISKEEFAKELGMFNEAATGKTVAGTNINEVKKQNYKAGNGKSSMKEEFAKEANFQSPAIEKITTDPDIANVNNHEVQLSKSKSKNGESGFTKMIEEIADEVGLFQSDNKNSSGKTKIESEFAQMKEKLLKPFKKD